MMLPSGDRATEEDEHVEGPSPGALAHRPLQRDRLRSLAQHHGADQHVRQTSPRPHVELTRQRRTTQIGLKQQYSRTHTRRSRRQMTRNRRLTVTRAGRSDEQRTQLPIDVEIVDSSGYFWVASSQVIETYKAGGCGASCPAYERR
jgi:hypothetical protein